MSGEPRVADVVIVGAGSAGCVLAQRLTQRGDRSVILVEAGGSDQHPMVQTPLGFAKLFRGRRDWALQSEPEPHLGDRSLFIPRGRMLGGSSSLNAMIYIRGRARDYDGWAAAGNVGWSWDDVLPYFVRAESNARLGAPYHGTDGPLRVEDPRSPSPISRAFVEAAATLGHTAVADFNGPDPTGVGLYQLTQRRGRRWSAADAYLAPARRRGNLTVVTDALVDRIAFAGDRAIAVELVRDGRRERVEARSEIVVCAGAIGSPAILLRSGIGPADALRALGIEVRVDRPAVGGNLQDHPVVPLAVELAAGLDSWWRGPISLPTKPRWRDIARYVSSRRGPLTSNVAEAGLFVDSGAGLVGPDLQFHVAPIYFVEHGFSAPPGHGFTLGPTLVSPTSRGRLRLRSADPTIAPAIVVGALGEPREWDALRRGLRLAREIVAATPLAAFAGQERLPGRDATTDAQLDAHIRRYTELLYHPCCTCAMGPTDDFVVDPSLRVRGVRGLRVVDASVMPTIVGGNTNAPTIMIAERAADLIDA